MVDHYGDRHIPMRCDSRRSRSWIVIVPALFLLSSTPALAQFASPTVRRSTDSIVARSDGLAAAGDTAMAKSILVAGLKAQSKNAALWHRYGILLWQEAASVRRGGYISSQRAISQLRLADSALRLATQFAPDSAEYWITLAQFNLQSGVGSMRFAASQQMSNAQSAAARVGDSAWLALAADEVGLATWRRFETTANRAFVSTGQHVQLQTDARWKRVHAKDFLESFAKRIEPPTGRTDYESALSQFRLASSVAPSSLEYSRHLYMALATDSRWDELLAVADRRAALSVFDAQARYARGVALHRLGRSREASVAFDSAMTLTDERERQELFRLDRLLPRSVNAITGKHTFDVAAWRAMPSEERDATSAMYWALNDPNSITSENESELEFIARVVQADWTWTDPMLGLHGANTDRGDIFIRYGPPAEQMTIRGSASVQQDLSLSKAPSEGGSVVGGMTSTSQEIGATLAWIYTSGDVFFFELSPGFGTGRTPLTDQQFVLDVQSVKPVVWDNFGAPLRVDSLVLRTTKFRAGRDSADVVLVSSIPMASLKTDGDSTPSSVRTDLRLIDSRSHLVSRDTLEISGGDALGLNRSWVHRIGRGATFVRLDAVNLRTHRSANALVAVDAAGEVGFGISDILLARAMTSQIAKSARRWRDLNLLPSAGSYAIGENVALAWETYELGETSEANRYRISITVERQRRSGATGFAVRVLDGIGGLVKQANGQGERLAVTFDRSVPANRTQVDYYVLAGLGTSSGNFVLTVNVTDLATNRVATRETNIIVR